MSRACAHPTPALPSHRMAPTCASPEAESAPLEEQQGHSTSPGEVGSQEQERRARRGVCRGTYVLPGYESWTWTGLRIRIPG
eukprot:scaffold997_cov418-Prasinococcus_capsulatus_cf.AAC.2